MNRKNLLITIAGLIFILLIIASAAALIFVKLKDCDKTDLYYVTKSNAIVHKNSRRAFAANKPIRIMALGDSITRGTYFTYDNGIADPVAGGYRKPLQKMLSSNGFNYTFVGDLRYWAHGKDGIPDPDFQTAHQGCAGFSSVNIIKGGVVPTPQDILAKLGTKELVVPGIIDVIARHKADIILLMVGTNGLNNSHLNKLVQLICKNFDGVLMVATIPPMTPPFKKWKTVDGYNKAILPFLEDNLKAPHATVVWVNVHAYVSTLDITGDGVHPNQNGLDKIALAWFDAIKKYIPRPAKYLLQEKRQ